MAGHKLMIATRDSTDAPLFVLGGLYATLAQLRNQHPRFGQGVKGFAHRYSTALADVAISDYLTEGVFPVMLREDPRYFRRGRESGSSMPHRIGYAVSPGLAGLPARSLQT